jgi:hypothetical protein
LDERSKVNDDWDLVVTVSAPNLMYSKYRWSANIIEFGNAVDLRQQILDQRLGSGEPSGDKMECQGVRKPFSIGFAEDITPGWAKVVGTVGSMETMECQGVTEPFNVGFREDVTPGSARVVGTVGPKPGRSFRNESKVKVILVRSVGTM